MSSLSAALAAFAVVTMSLMATAVLLYIFTDHDFAAGAILTLAAAHCLVISMMLVTTAAEQAENRTRRERRAEATRNGARVGTDVGS